ncbi:HAD family phosphatase [Martelella sp. HB161492]|uniref:HAD family hydrolase n=1 Tax=Martelella sp. HB161492 TaxID=2720726 RepID=UPI00158FE711|nr:HAD family phosphatase [Martelella sp. HB161492]
MTTEIRHIVFDIGKVLVHYDPTLPFQHIIPDEEKRKWFLANVCSHEWNHEQDRGRSWAEAEAVAIAAFPDEEDNIRAFRKYWHEMLPYSYDESVEILKALLAGGWDITMLTNFAPDTFKECRKRYPFLELSRGITVSGEIGMVKPDRDIFDHHVASFGLDPAATLFIDDTLVNVEGARAAGWQAVQFTDAATLKRDFEALGIRY